MNEDSRPRPVALPLLAAMHAWLPRHIVAEYEKAEAELRRNGRWVYRKDAQGRDIVELDATSDFNRPLLLRMREAQAAAEAAFLGMLRAGRLIAWAREGSPLAPLRRIPADAWATLRLVHVAEGRARVPNVELFAIHVAPAAASQTVAPAGEPKAGDAAEPAAMAPEHARVASTIAAERRLEVWLVEKMRANPHNPPGKAAIKREAEAAGHRVSERAFLRAYGNAVKTAGTPAWSAPGKKSKRRIETADLS
jgi:hypothetical protein